MVSDGAGDSQYLEINDSLVNCPLRKKPVYYKTCFDCLFYDNWCYFGMMGCVLADEYTFKKIKEVIE